jgi:murein DD-endopeptidase MepM/ murein hydrolase activator NlpD
MSIDFRTTLQVCLCAFLVALLVAAGFLPGFCLSLTYAAPSSRYQWPLDPVDRFVFSGQNDFGTYSTHQSNYYHTGMDLQSGVFDPDLEIQKGFGTEYVTPVMAVADGTVKAVYRTPDTVYRCGGEIRDHSDVFLPPSGAVNRGLGNVVVIEHPDGVYSLYGHLDCIDPAVVPGAEVARGAMIGKMGHSTTVRRAEGVIPHLHFEIKDVVRKEASPDELLGDPSSGGIYWGYTPDLPTGYGYHDPRQFIDPFEAVPLSPTPILILGSRHDHLNVRTGPGKQYPRLTGVQAGQKYIARQKSKTGRELWYAIDLPHARGTAVGWIAGQHKDCPGSVCAVEDPMSVQIEVLYRTKIRGNHGSILTPLRLHDKIYGCFRDLYARSGYRYVTHNESRAGLGCSGPYYPIDLPGTRNPFITDFPATKGWICSDNLSVVP